MDYKIEIEKMRNSASIVLSNIKPGTLMNSIQQKLNKSNENRTRLVNDKYIIFRIYIQII